MLQCTTAQPAGQPSTPATQAGSAIARGLDANAFRRGEERVLGRRQWQLRSIAGELHEAERGAGRPHERLPRVRATEAMAEIERGEEIAGAVGRGLERSVRNQFRTTRRDQ